MNPDVDALKLYIGGLVLDIFLARGEIKVLQETIKELEKKLQTEETRDPV